ncbi:YHYH domain-containing protein [Acinetobacter guillouiae]|nr:YHYH domain-containing protein [Acinetobacter guillouiae]
MKKLFFIGLISFAFTNAQAHSGGTDSSGCHTNSKTGDRHCH